MENKHTHSNSSHHSHSRKHKRKMPWWKDPAFIGILVLVLIVIGIILIVIRIPEDYEDDGSDMTYVEIDGKKYTEKTLMTVLFIGQDTEGPIESSHSFNNMEQADFLLLLAINKKTKSYSLLEINRDTMTGIEELDIFGQRTGNMLIRQIALSHTFGDGKTSSCLNTKRAVSDLLHGVTIDYFVSMSMSAVSEINDYIGGVTVTLPNDYTNIDPTFKKGETVTLLGSKALSFVRGRMGVDDGTNISRMERQTIYLNSFIEKMRGEEISESFAKDLFGKVVQSKQYVYTDCGLQNMITIVDSIEGYDFEGIKTIEGTAKLGTEFVEFYPDKQKLKELVIEMYFDRYSD